MVPRGETWQITTEGVEWLGGLSPDEVSKSTRGRTLESIHTLGEPSTSELLQHMTDRWGPNRAMESVRTLYALRGDQLVFNYQPRGPWDYEGDRSPVTQQMIHDGYGGPD